MLTVTVIQPINQIQLHPLFRFFTLFIDSFDAQNYFNLRSSWYHSRLIGFVKILQLFPSFIIWKHLKWLFIPYTIDLCSVVHKVMFLLTWIYQKMGKNRLIKPAEQIWYREHNKNKNRWTQMYAIFVRCSLYRRNAKFSFTHVSKPPILIRLKQQLVWPLCGCIEENGMANAYRQTE